MVRVERRLDRAGWLWVAAPAVLEHGGVLAGAMPCSQWPSHNKRRVPPPTAAARNATCVPQATSGEAFVIALAIYAAVCFGILVAFSWWRTAPWSRHFYAPKGFVAKGQVGGAPVLWSCLGADVPRPRWFSFLLLITTCSPGRPASLSATRSPGSSCPGGRRTPRWCSLPAPTLSCTCEQ